MTAKIDIFIPEAQEVKENNRRLKHELRARGQALGLPLPAGESQDVCFLHGGLGAFLAAQGFREQPGDI